MTAPAALRRPPSAASGLLRALQADTGASLAAHRAAHGLLPDTSPARLLADLERAHLFGRGGGGYPAAAKLAAVTAAPGRHRVVANGAESEPASRKDALLLVRAPHLVLDGLVIAARVTGATATAIALHEGSPALDVVRRALAERSDLEAVQLLELPRRYVASESSALLHALDGGAALPTFGPHAATTGTYVGNVETLARAAALAMAGGGAVDATTLLTVTTPQRAPRVLEVPIGSRIGDHLDELGVDSDALQAVLLGGYAGTWWPVRAALDLPVLPAGVATPGGESGAGIVVGLGDGTCPVAELAHVARWLQAQSARQCGPCIHGLASIADALGRLATGRPAPGDAGGLDRWGRLAAGRGACALPDGAVRFVTSGLSVFADHVAEHWRHGPCRLAGAARQLPLGWDARS